MSSSTPVEALERAIKLAGGQTAFADALTKRRVAIKGPGEEPVSQARVWNWLRRDKKAPAEFCPDIEALWGVACEELAPDVDWAVLRASGASSPGGEGEPPKGGAST